MCIYLKIGFRLYSRDGLPAAHVPQRYQHLSTEKKLPCLMIILQFKKDKVMILKKSWQVNFRQKGWPPLPYKNINMHINVYGA